MQDCPFPKPNQFGDDETDSSDDLEIPNNLSQTPQELGRLDPYNLHNLVMLNLVIAGILQHLISLIATAPTWPRSQSEPPS